MVKKFLAFVTATALAAGACAFSAFAEDTPAVATSGNCGESVTWSFDESTGVLTISGTGDMYTNYTPVDQWEYYPLRESVKEVVVEEGVTSIATCAFGLFDESTVEPSAYPNLAKLSLPSTVKVIGNNAFHKAGLTSIEFSEGLESIGERAFSYTTKLTSIDLPEGLKTIDDYAFNHTPLTGDLILPQSLNDIGQAAFAHTNIISVNLNEGMTLGGTAFEGCNNLKEVTIPKNLIYSGNGEVNMVRSNKAFIECKELEKVTILGGGTVKIPLGGGDMENGLAREMFRGCSSLKEIIIKADDISYVEAYEKRGGDILGTFDTTSNPTFYIYKDSTTEATLRDAGYLTDSNVVYIANKTVLEETVKSAEEMDVSQYTEESVDALNKAIEAGKAVIANETATQEDADNAVKAIEDAIEGLEVMQKGSISGTITAPGVDTEITVTVTNTDGEVIAEATATDGKYTVSDLEDGEYTIIVTAENCVPRSYDVTVADGDATLDAEIHLKGDINGDGEITTADVGIANSHAREVSVLEGYDFDVADVTGEGEVTTADVGAINSHAQSVSALW